MARVEVLAVGREILTGRRLESNANWVAKRIATLGGQLQRIAVVDDDIEAIGAEIANAKANGTDVLVITGGLGPTFDDVTLEGVAKALGVELEPSAEARQFIEDRYHELFSAGLVPEDGLNPAREKMACLPAGSNWFENPFGTAPGVTVIHKNMQIFCLPGVPQELYAMFDLAVVGSLAKTFDRSGFAELTLPTDATDESMLTRIARDLIERHKGLHVKTNPTYFGDAEGLHITLSVHAKDATTAKQTLEIVRAELEEALAAIAEENDRDA